MSWSDSAVTVSSRPANEGCSRGSPRTASDSPRLSPATGRRASRGCRGPRSAGLPTAPSSCRPRRSGLPTWAGEGLVTVGIDPDGELAEVAAGFSLDMAVLERADGVDAVELALRSAGGGPAPASRTRRAAVAAQLRSTLPPGTAGRVTGLLPDNPATGRPGDVELVAVSGYEPGDRLDGWYDALLATVSAGGPDTESASRAVSEVLVALPDTGVPHDGSDVSAVLQRLAAGSSVSGR